MKHILVIAYACSPYQGSEGGVGWSYIMALSKNFRLTVLVEEEKFKEDIQEYLQGHSFNNIEFVFIRKKRIRWLRRVYPPSYYWFYKMWHFKVYKWVRVNGYKDRFDCCFQLTLVGYRVPGFLDRLDIPLIWGPVGGLENTPVNLLTHLPFKDMLYFILKNVYNSLQRVFFLSPRRYAERAVLVFGATKGNVDLIKKYWRTNALLLSEVTSYSYYEPIRFRSTGETLKIIWVGKMIPGKNYRLMEAVAEGLNFKFSLDVIGDGPQREFFERRNKLMAVRFHGNISRNQVREKMLEADVLCITSIYDLTSTVLIEAISCGLAVVSFDSFGFSNVIDSTCGIKVRPQNFVKSRDAYIEALIKMYANSSYLKTLQLGAINKAKEYSLAHKTRLLNNWINERI